MCDWHCDRHPDIVEERKVFQKVASPWKTLHKSVDSLVLEWKLSHVCPIRSNNVDKHTSPTVFYAFLAKLVSCDLVVCTSDIGSTQNLPETDWWCGQCLIVPRLEPDRRYFAGTHAWLIQATNTLSPFQKVKHCGVGQSDKCTAAGHFFVAKRLYKTLCATVL